MLTEDKAYFMLGLAKRAGHLQSGDAAVRDALQRKKGYLLILSEDASFRTVRAFKELSDDFSIPLVRYGIKMNLGIAIGKPQRSVLLITDKNMALGFLKALGEKE